MSRTRHCQLNISYLSVGLFETKHPNGQAGLFPKDGSVLNTNAVQIQAKNFQDAYRRCLCARHHAKVATSSQSMCAHTLFLINEIPEI